MAVGGPSFQAQLISNDGRDPLAVGGGGVARVLTNLAKGNLMGLASVLLTRTDGPREADGIGSETVNLLGVSQLCAP